MDSSYSFTEKKLYFIHRDGDLQEPSCSVFLDAITVLLKNFFFSPLFLLIFVRLRQYILLLLIFM